MASRIQAWLSAAAVSATMALPAASAQKPSSSVVAPQAIKVADFDLRDQYGKSHRLHDLKDKTAVVLVWQGVGCPIVQQTTPSLKEAAAKYGPKSVAFLMVNSNIQDSPSMIRKEAESFDLELPILKDGDQEIARRFGVERTAEVVVLDPKKKWTVVYHGPLDDRLTYGRARAKANHHWATDVLDNMLAGKSVAYKHMPTDGCIISYAKPKAPG